jgi:hypothetical protein
MTKSLQLTIPRCALVEPMAALKVQSTSMTYPRHVGVKILGTILGTNQLDALMASALAALTVAS